MDKQKANKKAKKGIFKYVTLKSLIILLVMCIFNSYAWFIFATKVNAGIQAHVGSWNVGFVLDGETQASTNIVIDVSKIYPGMPDYTKVVNVNNTGETRAELSYEYSKVTILGTTFQVGPTYTAAQLKTQIETSYPFKVTIIMDQANLVAKTGTGSFTIKITWPYESGDDALDTNWGQAAYNYYQNQGDTNSLHIEVKLFAEQVN